VPWYPTLFPRRNDAEHVVQVILNVKDGACSYAMDSEHSDDRPTARFAHAACAVNFESSRHMCLFGGMGEAVDYGDVYSWVPSAAEDSPDNQLAKAM
jgi:hypothetical protein